MTTKAPLTVNEVSVHVVVPKLIRVRCSAEMLCDLKTLYGLDAMQELKAVAAAQVTTQGADGYYFEVGSWSKDYSTWTMEKTLTTQEEITAFADAMNVAITPEVVTARMQELLVEFNHKDQKRA